MQLPTAKGVHVMVKGQAKTEEVIPLGIAWAIDRYPII